MSDQQKRPFAKRSLGQNFLADPNYIRKIIDAIDPSANDTIIEIGPGRGALTEALVDSGAKVIAIELDRELVGSLQEQFLPHKNFSVFEADVLQFDFEGLLKNQGPKPKDIKPAKVAANLPYYISTAILQRLSEQRNCFSDLVLMFQREVAERIMAEPGNSERGFLTVLVEAAFNVTHLFDVPPSAFRPRPKIFSSVVRLIPKDLGIADQEGFRQLVSSAFAQKRKNILNNLKLQFPNASSALASACIDPRRRAETLSLDEWHKLFHTLNVV